MTFIDRWVRVVLNNHSPVPGRPDSKVQPHLTVLSFHDQLVERLYVGKYITITRRDDGTYRPNFRLMKVNEHFSIERFAVGVANELMLALECLIEER